MIPGRGVNFHLPQGGQFSAAVDIVVVAASTLGTAEILLRFRPAGLGLFSQVGRAILGQWRNRSRSASLAFSFSIGAGVKSFNKQS
jgi:hypothetical protein